MIAFLLFIFLQVADAWTTITAINLGGREANPIMEWFFKRLGVIETLFTLKSLTIILFGTVLYEHWIVWVFVCLYTIVVISNVMAIRNLKWQ